jgi:flavin-dependent dehydrogenase
VKDLSYAGSRIEGVKVKWGDLLEEFTGKVIIGADGVHSRIAQKIFFPGGISQSYAFAVRAYFSHVEGLNHYIEIHCEKSILPAYGWIFPTGEDSANIGVGISSRFLKKKDIKNLFHVFIRENRFLRGKLRKAQFIEDSFKGWPIPLATLFPRRGHKNVLLIGDAGCFADSLTGEGIYYALRGGECAAEAVHTGLNIPGGIARMGEIYEKLWRKAFQSTEYLIGKIFQRFVITEFFLNFNVRRALQEPIMGQTLASILCHQKTKIGMLF